jgi:hypothetical protein
MSGWWRIFEAGQPHQCYGGCKSVQASSILALERASFAGLKFVLEKFDSVQVNRPIANFSANLNRLFGARVLELYLDLASHGQVGGGEQANSAFTESHPAALDDRLVCRMINHDPHVGLKRITLPAAPIY